MNQLAGTRLKMWLVIVGVFVLGCVTGASLGGVYRSRGDGGRQHGERERRGDKGDFFEKMRRELNLNDDQAAQVRLILDETRAEFDKLRGEARPRYDAIRENSQTRIRAVLTPEQRQIFDAKTAERDARHKKRERSEH
jgi:Spy/CpxP family protein refolding chaperone